MFPVGAPVRDRDFVDRSREVKEILKALKRDSILLIAPRRFGKTSIMREVEKKLRNDGFLCVYLDVSYVSSPREFIIELADAIFESVDDEKGKKFVEKIKNCFRKLKETLGNIEELDVSTTGFKIKFREGLKKEIDAKNWIEKGNELIKSLRDITTEGFACIAVDEISECVVNINNKSNEDARKFIQWLRHVRQSVDYLRFLFGGSISFDRIVKNVGSLSWINDLRRVVVGGFSKSDAVKMIERAFKEEKWDYDAKIAEKILECIGEPYVPYFISVMLSVIAHEEKINLNDETVEKIYTRRVLGTYGRGYFDYYRQRLKTYGQMSKAAEEILRETCKVDKYPINLAFDIFRRTTGLDDYEKFLDLIHDLENDFYIVVEDREYIKFQLKILRDWWRVNYV